MFIQAYLNSAQEILLQYKGQEPLHSFLKKYFTANRKFGSRDRKYIAHLCYCFFRLGKSLLTTSISEKLIAALFLCDQSKNPLLEKLDLELNKQVSNTLEEKIELAKERFGFNENDLFPFEEFLSASIDRTEFSRSFLIQPLVYLRLRPGSEKITIQKLAGANVNFKEINSNCIAVEQAIKLDDVLEINKEAIIQDLSSQQVLNPSLQYGDVDKAKTVWDCCAASGGKSILLKDHLPDVLLTVSDIRESVLINLDKRFKQAGIKNYRKLVLDLSQSTFPKEEQFGLIICDAPCSGSGTWSRTPEHLYFFEEKKINYYAVLQKKIISNAVKNLKKDGFFIYITCSIFKKENEEVMKYVQDNLNLKLLNQTYLKGYCDKADTLFTALFTLIS